jgi:hypothetical protein
LKFTTSSILSLPKLTQRLRGVSSSRQNLATSDILVENIKDLQNAVEFLKAGILEDGWATRGEWKIANIDAVMKPAPPDGALRIHFRPRSLIGAIHLQLAQAATSGADVGTCEHCGLWFEMGPNGRKRGAKTCSRMCQIDMNNQKRKTKGASQ